jgi:exodeoxyribonuclease V alpha subunit
MNVENAEIQLNEDQEAAVELTLSDKKLVAITGPAGTGKTTLIKSALPKIRRRFSLPVAMLAPTGKAAVRMTEATGVAARTIHSYLMYDGIRYKAGEIQDILVIDEASMIEEALWGQLLRRRPPKIVLLGDPSQLAPVDAGQPFIDIVDGFPDNLVRLHRNYRSGAAIHETCMKIREGERVHEEHIQSGGEEVIFHQATSPSATEKMFIRDYVDTNIYDPLQDVLLCCRNGTKEEEVTVAGMNTLLREIYNPGHKRPYAKGDRVMCKKNFPEIDIYNGDVGTYSTGMAHFPVYENNTLQYEEGTDRPRMEYRSGAIVTLDRDPNTKRGLPPKVASRLSHAWCMTVHKSQGSQYRNVFILCSPRDTGMLKNQLIYTAVSRAREKCVVIGSIKAFKEGVTRKLIRRSVGELLYCPEEIEYYEQIAFGERQGTAQKKPAEEIR